MVAFVIVIVFAAVHLVAGHLRFLEGVPRSRALSIGSGISVAYVFLHLLPELSREQAALSGSLEGVVAGIEHHIYLLALVGLAAFYGLDRLAVRRRPRDRDSRPEPGTGAVFWVHIGAFALYNAVVGVILVQEEFAGIRAQILFGLAIAVHFLVNDFGLRQHHRDDYDRVGRWVLAVAPLAGWAAARATGVSEAWLSVLVALLAGAIILNVLKEELPEERESRFSAFIAGAALYSALLLAI